MGIHRPDPNENAITRRLLPRIVRENDPSRYCLPSSPYLDPVAFEEISASLISREQEYKDFMVRIQPTIEEKLSELSELEGQKAASVDQPAGIFGEILAKIFAFDLEGTQAKISATFGRCIGRWIYIIDAIDDYEKDREKGRYNPFLCLYGDRKLDTEIKKDIEAALATTLGDAMNALDLISFDGRSDLEGLIKCR